MARRAHRARIDAARREATRQRLLGTGMLPERVDELLSAWEAAPTSHGLRRDGASGKPPISGSLLSGGRRVGRIGLAAPWRPEPTRHA
jgi:hypothetical protein